MQFGGVEVCLSSERWWGWSRSSSSLKGCWFNPVWMPKSPVSVGSSESEVRYESVNGETQHEPESQESNLLIYKIYIDLHRSLEQWTTIPPDMAANPLTPQEPCCCQSFCTQSLIWCTSLWFPAVLVHVLFPYSSKNQTVRSRPSVWSGTIAPPPEGAAFSPLRWPKRLAFLRAPMGKPSTSESVSAHGSLSIRLCHNCLWRTNLTSESLCWSKQ